MTLDVTSLNHRRAVHRWERVSVGDILERLRWSVPGPGSHHRLGRGLRLAGA